MDSGLVRDAETDMSHVQPELSRRDFLAASAVGGLLASGAAAANDEDRPPLVIDCHAHIYGTDEKKYPTVEKPYRPPKGKGTIAHLQREMKAAGVKFVTAIQTTTYYRFDNRFTADSAKRHRDFMVGVVTLDPDDPRSPKRLEKYVRESNVRGMRSIPAKSGRLDDPGVRALWKTAERLGIVINVLAGRDKRREIETLVKAHPKLRIAIDHCLNLKAGREMKPTLKAMLSLAKLPTVHAKLTFIPTGSAEKYPCRDLHAPCREIIAAFTPRRCVWGSDFPCELWCPKVSYARHLRIFTHELGLDPKTQKAVLGETAKRLWFSRRDA